MGPFVLALGGSFGRSDPGLWGPEDPSSATFVSPRALPAPAPGSTSLAAPRLCRLLRRRGRCEDRAVRGYGAVTAAGILSGVPRSCSRRLSRLTG